MKKGMFLAVLMVCLLASLGRASPSIVWNPFVMENVGGDRYWLGVLDGIVFAHGSPYPLSWFHSREITEDDERKLELYEPDGFIGYVYCITEIEKGDLVDFNSVRYDNPVFDNNGWSHTTSVLTWGEPFYWGILFEMIYSPGIKLPLFGWVELLWDDEGLHMTNGAMEITGLGIYCGEFRAIPEPATMGLFLLGAGGLWWRRRGNGCSRFTQH